MYLNKIIDFFLFLYILSLYTLTYITELTWISNIIALLFISLIFFRILLSTQKIKYNTYLIWHLAFIIISFVSIIYARDYSLSLSINQTLISIFILIFAIINYIDSPAMLYKIMNYFILSGLIISIYILIISDLSTATRFGNSIGNVNAVGMIIGISSILSVSMYLMNKKKYYLLILIPMLGVVFLTGSRKSLLFVMTAILFIIYFNYKESITGKIKFLIVGLLTFLIISILISEVPIFHEIIGERIIELFSYLTEEGSGDSSLQQRDYMINFGLDLFKEKPVVGYGANNYRYMYGIYNGIQRYAHNNFIELLVNFGLFGTIVYYFSHFIVIKKLLIKINNKEINNKEINIIIYTFIALIISYFIIGVSLVYYYSKHFSVIIAVASTIPGVYKNINPINNEKKENLK